MFVTSHMCMCDLSAENIYMILIIIDFNHRTDASWHSSCRCSRPARCHVDDRIAMTITTQVAATRKYKKLWIDRAVVWKTLLVRFHPSRWTHERRRFCRPDLPIAVCTGPRWEWQRAVQQQRVGVLAMWSLLSRKQEKECPFYATTKEDEAKEPGTWRDSIHRIIVHYQ
jgi:hypothetical protein